MLIIENQEHYTHIFEKGIELAQKSVWISTANLKDMQIAMCRNKFISIVDFLNEKAQRGISIRLLYGGEYSRHFKSSLEKIKQSKLFELRMCIRNHFKCVIIDGKYMYLGSANMTGAGMGYKSDTRRNFEMGIISEDKKEIDKVQSLFNLIWSGEMCEECGRKKYCPSTLQTS